MSLIKSSLFIMSVCSSCQCIIFKQVTCEAPEVLCTGTTVERKVRALSTYWALLGAEMPGGTNFDVPVYDPRILRKIHVLAYRTAIMRQK